VSEEVLRPSDGGDLITRASADEVGGRNWIRKHEVRRDLDQEKRREGDVLFRPKAVAAEDLAADTQPFPNHPAVNEPIALSFTARRPNGQTAFICATPTRIFRYFALEDGDVFKDTGAGTPVYATAGANTPVFSSYDGTWIVIGQGFAADGHRWEAHNIDGYVVFNNGVDLPVSYRIQDFEVVPMHELRELGIAFVDTIEAEESGLLLLGGISEIHADYLPTVLDGADPYGRFTDVTRMDRVHYRVIWGEGIRFGPSGKGSIAAGQRTFTLDYDLASLKNGDEVTITPARAEDAESIFSTRVQFKNGKVLKLLDAAPIDLAGATIKKKDASSLLSGRWDLEDDGSPLLRLIEHGKFIFAAKDTAWFIGYWDETRKGFVFEKLEDISKGFLYWRWCVGKEDGKLVFAANDMFYTIDEVSRRPKPHPRLLLCQDVFFTRARPQNMELIHCANNTLTNELWFCFPSEDTIKGLCYDYLHGKANTIGEFYSAAAMIKKPVVGVQSGPSEDWFVAGLPNGTLVQYGLTADRTLEVYTRRGATYVSELWPGLHSFGDTNNEKEIEQYLLMLASQSPNSQVTVTFYGVRNPGEDPILIGTKVFASPRTQNSVGLHFQVHLIQDRLTMSGTTDVRISKRLYDAGVVSSKSFIRR
jgi:hypothetical protein